MASVKSRNPSGKGPPYRARYRDHAGKEHERYFDREREAYTWLEQVSADIQTGRYVDPKAGRITLATYAQTWEKNRVGGEAQARIVDNALRLHIVPRHGPRPLDTLRRSDVQGLVKALSLELAPRSVLNVYDVLARLLADAVRDRLIPETPCRDIALPSEPDEELVVPTLEEIAQLAGEVPARYRALSLLLAGSGLRIGEALGLQSPKDLILLKRHLHVRRQRLQSGALAPPKTPRSRRTLLIAPWLVETLAEHLARYPAHPDGFLFTTSRGNPLMYGAWRSVWTTSRANLDLEHISNHDLRHAYASALISGGASVKQVQTALGHESPAITLRTYTHLWPGDEDRTAAIIETAMAALAPVSRGECGASDHGPDVFAGQEGVTSP